MRQPKVSLVFPRFFVDFQQPITLDEFNQGLFSVLKYKNIKVIEWFNYDIEFFCRVANSVNQKPSIAPDIQALAMLSVFIQHWYSVPYIDKAMNRMMEFRVIASDFL
jgi:hypothetical protein